MKRSIQKLILLQFGLIISCNLFAQEKESAFGITFSGYVKNDFFYDTRQTVNAREGHLLLWPAAEKLDKNEDDINAEASFNFLSIQSRLTGKISGPDAFGAKTSGVIEGAFFGHSNPDINGFRLRHAFVKLNWETSELLMGQYWHPLFVTSCFPGVVSFNAGSGIQPFSRNPQIRFTQKFGNWKVFGVAFSERDFSSRWADASGNTVVSSRFLRNAGIPSLHAQIQYAKKNEDGTGFTAGTGIGYLAIQPRSVTDSNIVTNELVSGISAIAFAKWTTKPVTVKLEATYGENMPNVLFFGGYAVSDMESTTNEYKYTPFSNLAFWADIHTNGKKVQLGLFAGMNMNNGTSDPIMGQVYGLSPNIASVTRISPRIMFNSGKFRFATELEYTSAEYGDGSYNSDGIPQNTYSVDNIRLLLATYYFF